MTRFNYDIPGELYSRKDKGKGRGIEFRRFPTVAEAIRFAVEELPPLALRDCKIEVAGERLGSNDVRKLYDSNLFPLPKCKTSA